MLLAQNAERLITISKSRYSNPSFLKPTNLTFSIRDIFMFNRQLFSHERLCGIKKIKFFPSAGVLIVQRCWKVIKIGISQYWISYFSQSIVLTILQSKSQPGKFNGWIALWFEKQDICFLLRKLDCLQKPKTAINFYKCFILILFLHK